jgi:hypothetical protein
MLQELVASSALTELRVTSKLHLMDQDQAVLGEGLRAFCQIRWRPICETGRAVLCTLQMPFNGSAGRRKENENFVLRVVRKGQAAASRGSQPEIVTPTGLAGSPSLQVMLQATVNPEERAGVDTASHRAPLSSWGAPGPTVPEASLGVPRAGPARHGPGAAAPIAMHAAAPTGPAARLGA